MINALVEIVRSRVDVPHLCRVAERPLNVSESGVESAGKSGQGTRYVRKYKWHESEQRDDCEHCAEIYWGGKQ